jgi:predicted nucleic acid-binding Zn ribbon protein
MRVVKPLPVSDLLKLFIKENRLEESYRQYLFLKHWNDVTGDAVAKATIDKTLKGKKLYVSLSSSVVRYELFMRRSEIIRELNRRAGKEVINELILQ